jgi:hypothetical protein
VPTFVALSVRVLASVEWAWTSAAPMAARISENTDKMASTTDDLCFEIGSEVLVVVSMIPYC